jgi:hypothetical protein
MMDSFIIIYKKKKFLYLMNIPKVYLLKIINNDKPLYKIGYTTNTVEKRVKNIQTGCPYKISIIDVYLSEYSKVIEKTLHNILSHKKINGEWFELDMSDEVNFKKMCDIYHNVNETLKNNKI